jgi:hypothetical protein
LIAGAGLAIAGGVIGQLVSFRLTRADRVYTYRRDKLDALMAAALEDEHWLIKAKDELCFGAGDIDSQQPFDRVLAIANLHFPGRFASRVALITTRGDFLQKAREVRVDRIERAMAANKILAVTLPDKAKLDAVVAAYKPYLIATAELQQECAALAKDFV